MSETFDQHRCERAKKASPKRHKSKLRGPQDSRGSRLARHPIKARDDLGYLLLEFALGVLALGYKEDELVHYLQLHIRTAEMGSNFCVNLGQVAQGYKVRQQQAEWVCMLDRFEDALGTERWRTYAKEILRLREFRPDL